MICEHCGTDYVVVGQHDGDRVSPWHTHTAEKCRDILKAKLIRDLIEECYQRGLAASEARVRELEADVERLRDAVQLEISQRRVDDSYGRDKSACQTVSDILERRGNDFGLMSALAARKETPAPTHCPSCGVSVYGNHVQKPGEHYPGCTASPAPQKTPDEDVPVVGGPYRGGVTGIDPSKETP